MAAVTYRPAVAVKRIADDLIAKHHQHLDDVRIEYVFRSETAKSKGKEVWGTARKISGLNAYLSQEDGPTEAESGDVDYFVIVDHELCHCTTTFDDDDNLKLTTRTHDVEEFRSVVKRHGLWRPDVALVAEACPESQRSIDDALTDPDDDIAVRITHTTAQGETRSLSTTTGEISKAADLIRNGSGLQTVAAADLGGDAA